MIVTLEGRLGHRTPLSCVIEIQGIGYEVFIPLMADLPEIGQAIKLWTYAIYREDNQLLYGFNSLEERDFFKLIVEKVAGIGPKTALAMLSKFKLSELTCFIVTKNVAMLAGIPGIGKKTAEKVILELSDKIKDNTSMSGVLNSPQGDAILGLVALGYKRSDAETMIRKMVEKFPTASVDQLIKNAIAVR
ncbi:MAG: Holliday junction branch migration protein RuvA [Puniceicoccales bacterium]|nr:Holliday junction branch migration protein RuvA [Puniceicoccales bacterium]